MGNDIAVKRIPRGKGYHNTGTTVPSTAYNTELEGTVRMFEDYVPTTDGTTPSRLRSNRSVTAILVRNVSGIALLPRMCVTWKAGYVGSRVDGYARIGHADGVAPDDIAGVVDEYYPASGVPDGELFWLVIRGPTTVRSGPANDATDWAVGDLLLALTAAASTHSTTAGRLIKYRGTFAIADVTGGTVVKQLRQIFARALSTKLTNSTNQNILCEVDSTFRG